MRNPLHVALADHLLPRLADSTLTGLVEELASGWPNMISGETTYPRANEPLDLAARAVRVCLLGRCAQLEYAAVTVGDVQNGVLRLCEELQPCVAAILMNGWDHDPYGTADVVLAGIGMELERRRAA